MLNQKSLERIKNMLIMSEGRGAAIHFKQLFHYAVNEEIATLSRGAELAKRASQTFKKAFGLP